MKKLLLTFTLLLTLSFNAFADVANGTFVAPIKRIDNSTLDISEIAGFQVYKNDVPYGELLPNTATTFTIPWFSQDKTLTMTTIDTEGRESDHTAPITLDGKGNPGEPIIGNITITISINTTQ